VPSSDIRIKNPKTPQVCRNQQRKSSKFLASGKDIRIKTQNTPKFVEMGKKNKTKKKKKA
jgi:hypothetical protein